MQTILITGGTGLVGQALTKKLLDKGYKVIILTRSAGNKKNSGSLSYAGWDLKNQTIDKNALQLADHIILLAGAPVVEKKWTPAYQKEIVESRTAGSKLIIDSLKTLSNKVKTIISASGIGWYGEDREAGKLFIETDEVSTDFLGETCRLWEQAVEAAAEMGIRVCKIRTGIVLSNEGGALSEFKRPLRYGIAAILGSGKQMVSWIHMDDLCRIYIYAIENVVMNGSYNAVSPTPVTNKQFTLTLARNLRGNFFIPMHVPVFIIKLLFGSRSVEVLKSTTASCAKIKEAGFSFLYPSVDAAFKQLAAK
jgi:uncharacterized protein (TIGR01777 family)